MIAIRKEKREEAMAKKRINVGASGGSEINPNVFNDASDSTAMTHEQRTNAKVRLCSFITPLERALKEEGDLASSSVFFQSKGGFN